MENGTPRPLDARELGREQASNGSDLLSQVEPGNQRINVAEDQIARGLTRAITRRTAFSRMMRGSLVVGGALASPMALFTGQASATYCTNNGTWGGCECAQTTNCGELGAACTAAGACNPSSGLRVRCNFWGGQDVQGQYCWCGTHCTYGGGNNGHRVCCDCWKGGSGSCKDPNGGTPCICVHWHPD